MPSTRTAILSATDYYPYGMAISSRSSVMPSEKYAFGFGGQQISDEINANSYTAQFWQYDARTGRRLNLDPIDQFSISNYAAFRNNPIAFVDPLGNAASKQTNQKLGNGDSQIMTDILEDGNSGLDVHASDEVTGLSKDYHIDDAVVYGKRPEKAPADNAGAGKEVSLGTQISLGMNYLSHSVQGNTYNDGELGGDIANMGTTTKQDVAVGMGVVCALSGIGAIVEGGIGVVSGVSLMLSIDDIGTNKQGQSFIESRIQNNSFKGVYSGGKTLFQLGTRTGTIIDIGINGNSIFKTSGLLLDSYGTVNGTINTSTYFKK